MILFDTNVLLRAAQPGHPQYASAKSAVTTARMRGYRPCLVPQVVYEYWVVATRSAAENGLGMTAMEAEADINQLVRHFHLFRDERAILDRWRQLVVQLRIQGKTAHDARLVAAMDRHGIRHLVTFNDQHFQRFSGIAVFHPNRVHELQPL
jgi:predicted nucleic acid-binding protein